MHYVPAVTDLLEPISWKTAEIPSLGRDDAASEVKSDAEGGGGGTGACDGGSFATEGADADEQTTALPAEPQVRPSG